MPCAWRRRTPIGEIVFVGVGFETTTPLVAMAIKRARAMGLANFTVYGAHKNMPGALEVIINDPALKLDALILPGHVSTIIGAEPYRFLAEKYGIPGVITGFEPVDVLQGIAMIMRQLHEGRAEIEIAYARGVMPEGNPVATRRHRRGVRNLLRHLAWLGRDSRQRLPHPRGVRRLRRHAPLPTRRGRGARA